MKAADADVLAFAAHHLDLGAHRLFLYLDAPDAGLPSAHTHDRLKAHPKIRVTRCDAAWWRQRGRKAPEKHQVRQTHNATYTYARKADVTWLAHIDVDEFLCPEGNIAALLGALAPDALCLRVFPDELLAGGGTAYKRHIPRGPERERLVDRLYPAYGRYLRGGFLSHVEGKLFARTGLPDISFRIHNIRQGDVENPGMVWQPGLSLLHHHAPSWEAWRAAYDYRLAKGSYRAELRHGPSSKLGPINPHTLFRTLAAQNGERALRGFFDEVAADTAAHRALLAGEGLLRVCDLDLDTKVRAHFG